LTIAVFLSLILLAPLLVIDKFSIPNQSEKAMPNVRFTEHEADNNSKSKAPR
jgi:hypothetical protein